MPTLFDGHFVHSLLVAAFADEFVDFDRRVVEISLGQVVEVVAATAGIEQVAGDHRIERDAGKRDADVAEHNRVVLQVLAELADLRVFQDWVAVLRALSWDRGRDRPAGPRTGM